ncbi:MAG: sigma-54 dependent transcriptional regulator [Candidatus Solibacter sp.]|nr:sigma-54 dependent transcriptional regulator [Candidatus Solibacter sp.]
MATGKVLVVEDDDSLRRVTQLHLEKLGFSTTATATAEEALRIMGKSPYDVLLTDLHLPGLSGIDLLKKVKTEYPDTIVIVITAFATVVSAVEAMKSGAYDYITKPLHHHELNELLRRAIDHQQLRQEVGLLRSALDQKYGFEQIVGSSSRFAHTISLASRAAASDATVLITGATGTGKELLAKAIHFRSSRKARPMVTINCGAIPRDLLESELFGHVKGSFTGALTHKQGRVEAADGGTVFLDEIGEMPFELQVRILRLIQEREIDKVGSTAPTKVDVRIIAATHRNIEAMVEDGSFREDLYYRLAVVPIQIPPLRERPSDILELVQHFFEVGKQKHNRPSLRLPPELLPLFSAYSWPGNVRQVENLIERLIVLCDGNEITVNDLPEPMRATAISDDLIHIELPPQGLDLEAVEKELITKALRKFDGNQTKAAAYLNLSRKTFLYRLEKFGIVTRAAAGASSVGAAVQEPT